MRTVEGNFWATMLDGTSGDFLNHCPPRLGVRIPRSPEIVFNHSQMKKSRRLLGNVREKD